MEFFNGGVGFSYIKYISQKCTRGGGYEPLNDYITKARKQK